MWKHRREPTDKTKNNENIISLLVIIIDIKTRATEPQNIEILN